MKIYDVCHSCGNIVQVNKILFGGLHFCSGSSEGITAENNEYLRKRYFYNKKLLKEYKKGMGNN